MKYVYFEPTTKQVIRWLDTEKLNMTLPDSVMPVSDAQWRYSERDCWVNPEAGKLIVTPPPGEFYRLDGDRWVYDADAYSLALTAEQERVTGEIKQHRDAIMADYIDIDGHHFHSDTGSRIQQLTLTKMGKAREVPPGLMWVTKNHGPIVLTNEIAARFEAVTIDHDMRLFAVAQGHIASVQALTDIEAVASYDWSQGWQP